MGPPRDDGSAWALRSPPVVGTITLAQLVGAIEGLRRALDIESWHVVGHSWGGLLAAEYAGRHPGRVDSLVLVCPALDWVDSIQATVACMADQLEARDSALAADVRRRRAALSGREPIWAALMEIWSAVPPDVIYDMYNPGLDTEPFARWLAGALAAGAFTEGDRMRAKDVCEQIDWAIFAAPATPRLQRYGGPIHLLIGQADPVCTKSQQAAIAASGGSIRWLAGGHKPFVECPQDFAAAVKDWILARPAAL